MGEELVQYNIKDRVAWVTINSPESGNKVDLPMAQKIAGVCSRIDGDEEVYLVVITGAGETFCSGGDIRLPVSPQVEIGISFKDNPAESIGRIDRPTVAALNGDAIGLGLEIALACDMRIASDKARFGLPQITEGLIPMGGGTQRLSRIVGKGPALEMILTGEIINAQKAFEIGLVNKLVPQSSFMSEIETMARTLAAKAPIAMRYAKEAVNKGLDLTLEQGLRLEADLYFLIHTTADRTEGIHSFLQKRPPEYKGK